MAYWLYKSEPSAWSWDDQVKAGAKGTNWSGVRNHTAKLNMMAMKKGDQGFFYHSNEGKEIVGIVEVIKEYYPDPTDPKGIFGMVDIKAIEPLPKPSPLWDLPNVLISPHSASTVAGENAAITDIFCRNIPLFLEGERASMQNILDKVEMY